MLDPGFGNRDVVGFISLQFVPAMCRETSNRSRETMHRYVYGILISGSLTASAFVAAQEPDAGRRSDANAKRAAAGGIVARMMKFDKNKDEKLVKSEVTDERLRRLFDQADADKDGTLTKEELTAFAAKEQAKTRGCQGWRTGGFRCSWWRTGRRWSARVRAWRRRTGRRSRDGAASTGRDPSALPARSAGTERPAAKADPRASEGSGRQAR